MNLYRDEALAVRPGRKSEVKHNTPTCRKNEYSTENPNSGNEGQQQLLKSLRHFLQNDGWSCF